MDDNYTEIENMKFEKKNLNNLEFNSINDLNLDELFKIDKMDELKDEKINKIEKVNKEDIDINKTEEKYSEIKDEGNIKKIVIDEDKKNSSIKKYTKNKNKSFKFFD